MRHTTTTTALACFESTQTCSVESGSSRPQRLTSYVTSSRRIWMMAHSLDSYRFEQKSVVRLPNTRSKPSVVRIDELTTCSADAFSSTSADCRLTSVESALKRPARRASAADSRSASSSSRSTCVVRYMRAEPKSFATSASANPGAPLTVKPSIKPSSATASTSSSAPRRSTPCECRELTMMADLRVILCNKPPGVKSTLWDGPY